MNRVQSLLRCILVNRVYEHIFDKNVKTSKRQNVKKKYIIAELIYAVPIIAMQASIFSMNSSDKFFLSNFTNDNNETVGIYSVGCIFASIIIVLCTALLQYIFPKIYTLLAAPDIDYRSIKNHFLFYTAVIAAGTLLVVLLTPLLYHYFINDKYHPALRYTYLLCVGYFLWSVSYFFYSFLLYHKKKKNYGLLYSVLYQGFRTICNYQ